MRKPNNFPNARGKRSRFTVDEYPMDRMKGAVRHLHLTTGAFLRGRATSEEVAQAIRYWFEAQGRPWCAVCDRPECKSSAVCIAMLGNK